MQTILIAGGLNRIGSELAINLLNLDYRIIIVDDCSSSSEHNLFKIVTKSKHDPIFFKGDVNNDTFISSIMSLYRIDGILNLVKDTNIPISPVKQYSVNELNKIIMGE